MHMLQEVAGVFPAGFLGSVQKAAKEAKVALRVLDVRKRPVKLDADALLDWLRSYQLEALDIARTHERGVFHHVTSAGKTELMVGLGEMYPCRWLVLTHSKDLLGQTGERFAKRTGEQVGLIGDGKWSVKRVTIATFQSIYAGIRKREKRVLDLLKQVQGLMIDECHIVPSETFYQVVMATPNAFFRYGFSGTPFARGDKKSIFTWGALGPVIHRITADRLIAEGVIAKPHIHMAIVRERNDAGTWAQAYANGVTGSTMRNAAVIKLAKKATKPCLLFVKEIAHGKLLESKLRAAGTKVEFVWGAAAVPVRKAAVRRLVHGDTDVLICNVIFQMGIDIPELQSVIIASGGKSAIMALQDVGRGMRRHSHEGKVTKTEFSVYDIADRGCGCPPTRKHRGCKWLEKHTRQRLKAYAIEKYEVTESVI